MQILRLGLEPRPHQAQESVFLKMTLSQRQCLCQFLSLMAPDKSQPSCTSCPRVPNGHKGSVHLLTRGPRSTWHHTGTRRALSRVSERRQTAAEPRAQTTTPRLTHVSGFSARERSRTDTSAQTQCRRGCQRLRGEGTGERTGTQFDGGAMKMFRNELEVVVVQHWECEKRP